jgi:phytoene dehydrogenase-like protein
VSKIAIIGSGIGGLTCGNLLAGKGHKVSIFESHSTPGGYTAGFWRKGFYFESGTVSFESLDIIKRAMKDIGVLDKLEFTRQRIRWLSPRFDFIPETLDDIRENIINAYPDDKDELVNFFSEIGNMIQGFMNLSRPSNLLGFGVYPFKLARSMNLFRKHSKTTLSDFCAQFFRKDSEPYQLFSHMGYPEMSALILAAAFLTFTRDYWTVKTGMQSWADALADNFTNLGGELRLNSLVDAIVTKNGTAIGVRSKGKEFKADDVISAGDFKKTFLKLLDNRSVLPQDFVSRAEKAQVSEAFFTVYLGLNISAEELGTLMKIPHVHYHDYIPGCDINDSNDEAYFDKTSPSLFSPSVMNSKLAPAGKSSLMVQCMCPHRWMDNWGNGDRKIYEGLKNKVAQSLIKKASAVIPGLSTHIIFMDAATPLTYERYTHNTDGASSAWSWNPHKKFYKNPIGVTVNTPLKNLLLSSCWTAQIGGVPSAINAAYKCAKVIK